MYIFKLISQGWLAVAVPYCLTCYLEMRVVRRYLEYLMTLSNIIVHVQSVENN